MDVWIIWLVAACVLGVGEMHQGGFYLAPFAVGAGLAAVAGLVGVGGVLSAIVFVAASAIVFTTLRPVAQRERPIAEQAPAEAVADAGAVNAGQRHRLPRASHGAASLGARAWLTGLREIATLRWMRGGGDDCYYPDAERPSAARRIAGRRSRLRRIP